MRKTYILCSVIVLLVLGSILSPGALCAQEGGGGGKVLVVGTKVAPPFAIKGDDGRWRGIGIELWEGIAEDLGVEYELRETDLEGLLTGLEDGSLDVSVAALTVTAPRERRVDFTHPFYSSGLGIAVPAGGTAGWLHALRGLVRPRFLAVVGSLAGILFIAGLLVWLFERRRNPEQFGDGVHGLGSAFWWSAVTMTTVGYGDKAPVSAGGRAVALVWMFASVIMISGFTAAIASSLTVARLGAKVQGPDDLPRARVATVTGSTSEAYLEERFLRYEAFDTLPEALDAVAAGAADAVVYDAPLLRYLTQRREGSGLQVLPQTFEPQLYAIALPQGSTLREPINRALLERVSVPGWKTVLDRYLGD